MFLRSLTLRGFKSFAEKTNLEFTPGIAVIVGPNGSGKSNIVDAIAWVLGEQGPRALRGGQMADVIFAGSPTRPALGMAEVKLVIDNAAGLIPVPLSEIEVARTIFRSGESEYRLNGQSCRLLDIQEMLAETGIGRALHTIVGQGQLDEILHSRPEERRQFIEEAAGIAKHKRRKERAQRKLTGIEQDVLRLNDVLSELRRQLKPLKQQAEMAKRHEKLTSEADDLAWRLAAARLRSLYAVRDGKRTGWDEGLERRDAARKRLDELDARLADLTAAREAAAAVLVGADAAYEAASGRRSEAEAMLRKAIEREADARHRLGAETARTARLAQVDDEIVRLESHVEEVAEQLAERERELEAAELVFRQADRARRDVEEERRRLEDDAVAHRAEVETLRRSVASSDRDLERLATGLDEVRQRAETLETQRVELENRIEELDAKTTPLSEKHAALEAERQRLTAEVTTHEEALRKHEARRALAEGRTEDLQGSAGEAFLERHRGRAVGLLRDLIRVEPGLEKALAAALGPYADAVIYEDRTAAIADAHDADGAIIAMAFGDHTPFALRGERALFDEVKCDQRAYAVVSTLLKDVYIAQDADALATKAREHPRMTFVTPDGVLVGYHFMRKAAEADAKLHALKREADAAQQDLSKTAAALRPVRDRLAAVKRDAEAVAADLERLDGEITRAAEQMGRLDVEISAVRREERGIAERLAGLEDAAGGWREQLARIGEVRTILPPLPPVPDPPVGQRVEVETLRRERQRMDSTLGRLHRERQVLAAEDPDQLRANLVAAEADRGTAEEGLRAADEALTAAADARTAAATAARETAEAENAANREWRDASGELERLRDEYESEDRARGDLERRIREHERLLKEGHERDPAEAVASLADDDAPEALEKRADVVQRRLALLGRVNLLASEEFETLQERHDFLARELDDVKKARRDLLEVIRQVDDEVVRLFDQAFRDVAREFEHLFVQLFPGGEGRLVLTDPANMLESGIELEARPGRKRVKRISLLSGGERSLTALAFLFAIFKARPSPFYLLDEVEAALDDTNLVRFIRLIQAFSKDSQVLVVTHQKRTMETADILYGVSMGKDGASAVISQRFDREHDPEVLAHEAAEEHVVELPEAQPDAVR